MAGSLSDANAELWGQRRREAQHWQQGPEEYQEAPWAEEEGQWAGRKADRQTSCHAAIRAENSILSCDDGRQRSNQENQIPLTSRR